MIYSDYVSSRGWTTRSALRRTALYGLLALSTLVATDSALQARDSQDPRVRTIVWQPDAVIELGARPGRTLAVMLAPGEQVIGISVAEPGAFAVTASVDGDGLLVTPRVSNARSVLTVSTDAHSYRFDLVVRDGVAPSIVRLTYPRKAAAATSNIGLASPTSGWNLSGDRHLRPVSIRDDGAKTFIVWGEDQAIPAVFAVASGGREQVVDGYMRDGTFVIDRVHERLVFRIDRDSAVAIRKERSR